MKAKLPKVGSLIQIVDVHTTVMSMLHYSNASPRYTNVFEILCKETNGVFEILKITETAVLIAVKGRFTSQILIPNLSYLYSVIK